MVCCLAFLCEEDVLALEVAMEDLAVVHVLDGQTQLHRPVEYLLFSKGDALLCVDARVQITCKGLSF